MPLPEIDFNKIRIQDGDQRKGFEELCTQLFRFRFGLQACVYRIEGSGGDGGVEAFVNDNDGNVIGMQAKYFHCLEETQWTQIQKSVQSAKKNYPHLIKYIVACPLDRTPNQIKKWKNYLDSWNQDCALPILFEWWGKSELLDLLCQTRDQGYLAYWFDFPEFTHFWCIDKFNITLANLDHRYTPDMHIATETEKALSLFIGKNIFQEEVKPLLNKVSASWDSFFYLINKQQPLITEANDLVQLFSQSEEYINDIDSGLCDFIAIMLEWKPILDNLFESMARFRGSRAYDSDTMSQFFTRFEDAVWALIEFAKSFSINQYPCLLLLGEAGSGKSHQLARLMENHLNAGHYGVMVTGEQFVNEESVSTAFLRLINLKGQTDLNTCLSVLDVAAQTTSAPALICIDAINESEHRLNWQRTLLDFVNVIRNYKHIKLIISCRNDFVDICIPDALRKNISDFWFVFHHQGFLNAQIRFKAIATYFSAYRVKAVHLPPAYSEFRNPLFLKTFCEVHENNTISSNAFTFLNIMQALRSKIETDLQRNLDCPPRIVRAAIDMLVNEMIQAKSPQMEATLIAEKIDGLFSGHGDSRSLYRHIKGTRLISEFTVSGQVNVRFSYDRFSDFFFAFKLSENIDTMKSWLEKNGAKYRGILTSLFAVVPDQHKGLELFELLPTDFQAEKAYQDCYIASLAWRTPQSFTTTGIQLFKDLFNQWSEAKQIDVLLPLATILAHPFNVDFLTGLLFDLPVWSRDVFWTQHINQLVNDDAELDLNVLLDWVQNSIDQSISVDQVLCISRLLIWCLTSSVWSFRDKVTRVLIQLLCHYPNCVVDLITQFHGVNDPYITERLYAVAAGVVMRIQDKALLAGIAEKVYQTCFSDEETNPHILLRHYASTVMEVVLHKKALPESCLPERFRPPFESQWPEIIISDSDLADYEKKDALYRVIINSLTPEGVRGKMYGDFGRYVMGSKLDRFFNVGIASDVEGHRFIALSGQKWIFQRVLELGWRPDLFAYDVGSNDRHHRPHRERISKKYQWIGLYEFLGYVSDHFKLSGDRTFEGVWQINAGDFDPSVIEEDVIDDQSKKNSLTFFENWGDFSNPIPPKLSSRYKNREDWVFDQDIPDVKQLLRSNQNSKWLLLSGNFFWEEDRFSNEDRMEMWIHVRSYIINKKDFDQYKVKLEIRNYYGNGIRIPIFDYDLGTYPWRISNQDSDPGYCRWLGIDDIPADITTWEYYNEQGEPVIQKLIPSPFLIDALSVSWAGTGFDFVDDQNNVVVFNPSYYNSELENICVVDRSALLAELKKQGKMIFWILLGEKKVLIGEKRVLCGDFENYPGDLHFSELVTLKNEDLVGSPKIIEIYRKKMEILKDEIENEFQQMPYISYSGMRSALQEKGVQLTNSTFKTYLHKLSGKTNVTYRHRQIFSAGKGWYTSLRHGFVLDKLEVLPIAEVVLRQFPDMPFSVWSTAQLQSFVQHMFSRFVTFVYTDRDYFSDIADCLKENGFTVFENPSGADITKYGDLKDHSVIIRPLLSRQPDNGDAFGFVASIEKILVDFLVESRKLKLLDYPEAEQAVISAILSARINMASLISYAKRRKVDISNIINQVQKNIKSGDG